jgi:hypothetical protein
LESLPKNVTHLYFILSSWNAPNVGCYKTPSFKLFDADHPDDNFCKYELTSARSKAVIVCCVSRNGVSDNWDVIQIGRQSGGDARDYGPVEHEIERLGLA